MERADLIMGAAAKSEYQSLASLGPLLAVWVVQVLIVTVVIPIGSFSISDDDAARVVIAQGFVKDPSLDPSGTSWLPVPFVLTGTFMLVAGATLEVARWAAVVGALVAATLLFFSARLLGARPTFAALATMASAALPLAAHLAAAPVPEYPTAALVVFAAVALEAARSTPGKGRHLRWLGGVAFFLACGSRYETWAPAFAFAVFLALDAKRGEQAKLSLLGAASAVAFPLSWLVHGFVNHQDPFFFVKRVVDYKHALAGADSWFTAVLDYPRALLFAEPEAVMMAAFAAGFLFVDSERRRLLPVRTLAILATLAGALIVSAARGGSPTHHPERALLACLLVAPLLVAGWARAPLQRRVLGFAVIGALLGAGLRITSVATPRAFLDRSREEAVGDFIEERLPEDVVVALALPDFGYFTVMAAASHPARFEVLERHDPRDQSEQPTVSKKLTEFVEGGGCYWVSENTWNTPSARTLFSREGLELRQSISCPAP